MRAVKAIQASGECSSNIDAIIEGPFRAGSASISEINAKTPVPLPEASGGLCVQALTMVASRRKSGYFRYFPAWPKTSTAFSPPKANEFDIA